MKVSQTIKLARKNVSAARKQGKTIGLVPTMGALHRGHISLIEAAKKKCDYVVVSIFVNPTQFGPSEDFGKYPRPLEEDLKMCKKAGADLVFNPSVEEMYPEKNITWVNVEKITENLCGRSRPRHFRGVTTVCTKLFNIVAPDMAFFGQKDAQQAIVIKRMVADLNMPLKIIVCPTVREQSGLALSSRNKYLSEQEREDAAYIYKSLQKCKEMIDSGGRNTETLINEMRNILQQKKSIKIEYISIVDEKTLENIDYIQDKALAAVAVRIGSTRLIDNFPIDITR
ncbi:MAG: pantoate--beta-alanine ligase [Sedimentisphaerales bacterium]|nr:pantoate--beta-alanine ligase [Sedimentisphaerales bacterium]